MMYQKVNLNKNIMKTQSILIALAMTFFTQISIAQKAFTVNVKGKGAPILLFPGFGCTGELWEETGVTRDLVEPVAKTHGWVTYDLPPDLLGKVWGNIHYAITNTQKFRISLDIK